MRFQTCLFDFIEFLLEVKKTWLKVYWKAKKLWHRLEKKKTTTERLPLQVLDFFVKFPKFRCLGNRQSELEKLQKYFFSKLYEKS